MAIMLPSTPREFDPRSREGVMFHALKNLPDDWYVLHSFQISKVDQDEIRDFEADFVVFHPRRGILCIEAKATRVQYLNGEWCYATGKPMNGGGPFAQARRNMYAIRDLMTERGLGHLVPHCKFLHAVWFPLVTQNYIRTLTLPAEAAPELILTEDALYDPLPYLERIFSIAERGKTETTLSDAMASRVVNEVLCPQFEIAPSMSFDADTKRMVFHRLLREQANILNFLEEQKTAAINGAAGTGKTLVAVEKARRHAARGEKVLFLCFNAMLKTNLAETYAEEHIDFYTIAGFACRLCATSEPDYAALRERLDEMYYDGSFPYDHVVVDEGQDFGSDSIEEADILDSLKAIIEDTKESGSFYVFYDKLQLVQARKMPRFLTDADCKFTLYRNCRNTENIAKTSLRPVSERNPRLMENCIVGVPAAMHFCPDAEAALGAVDDAIDALFSAGIDNIVILTCKRESDSVLAPYLENGAYPAGKKSLRFTTCRKFKGLEADAVILVDVEEDTFRDRNVLLYYVGTSRARLRLDIVTTIHDDACVRVLELLGKGDKVRRPMRDLAKALNARPIICAEEPVTV